jgi:glycerol-3-phosphate dehydrogenase
MVEQINKTSRNPKFFSDYELNPKIQATNSVADALKGMDPNLS